MSYPSVSFGVSKLWHTVPCWCIPLQSSGALLHTWWHFPILHTLWTLPAIKKIFRDNEAEQRRIWNRAYNAWEGKSHNVWNKDSILYHYISTISQHFLSNLAHPRYKVTILLHNHFLYLVLFQSILIMTAFEVQLPQLITSICQLVKISLILCFCFPPHPFCKYLYRITTKCRPYSKEM